MPTYSDPAAYDKHYSIAISPFAGGTSDDVGNITVDSDQPNQGPNKTSTNGFYLKARSGNTGNVRFSFDSGGDSDGYELAAGESIPVQVQNLNELWFTTDTAGNKFCWLKA